MSNNRKRIVTETNSGWDENTPMEDIVHGLKGKSAKEISNSLQSISDDIGAYGVEAIRNPNEWSNYFGDIVAEYINMGDTYVPTIVLDTVNEEVYAMSWGDFLEQHGQDVGLDSSGEPIERELDDSIQFESKVNEMKHRINEENTRDLTQMGARERMELVALLTAWNNNGLPDGFGDDEVTFEFNPNSGYVFLTNSDYQSAMESDGKLYIWHNTPYSGLEGSIEDIMAENDPDSMHSEDVEYVVDWVKNYGADSIPENWQGLIDGEGGGDDEFDDEPIEDSVQPMTELRKVTDAVVNAFLQGMKKSVGNTMTDGIAYYLHGNKIAEKRDGALWITNAGWQSNTTKERLNGLPGVSIAQKQGTWYLNGQPWDGEWIEVGPIQESRRRLKEADPVYSGDRSGLSDYLGREMQIERNEDGRLHFTFDSGGWYFDTEDVGDGVAIINSSKKYKAVDEIRNIPIETADKNGVKVEDALYWLTGGNRMWRGGSDDNVLVGWDEVKDDTVTKYGERVKSMINDSDTIGELMDAYDREDIKTDFIYWFMENPEWYQDTDLEDYNDVNTESYKPLRTKRGVVKEARESEGNIQTVEDFEKELEDGPYAWPGGYPKYFITADGAALSFEAAEEQKEQIKSAIQDNDTRGGWRVLGVDVNWEDPDLYCDHTGKKIECAYCEDNDGSDEQNESKYKPSVTKKQLEAAASLRSMFTENMERLNIVQHRLYENENDFDRINSQLQKKSDELGITHNVVYNLIQMDDEKWNDAIRRGWMSVEQAKNLLDYAVTLNVFERNPAKERQFRSRFTESRLREASYTPRNASGRYVNLEVLPNNDLKLTLTDEGNEELRNMMDTDDSNQELNFGVLFEDIQGNSEYSYSPNLGDEGFGLTEAPGIIMGSRGDNGEWEDDVEVWYYNDYMLRSFLMDILDDDGATFTYAESDGSDAPANTPTDPNQTTMDFGESYQPTSFAKMSLKETYARLLNPAVYTIAEAKNSTTVGKYEIYFDTDKSQAVQQPWSRGGTSFRDTITIKNTENGQRVSFKMHGSIADYNANKPTDLMGAFGTFVREAWDGMQYSSPDDIASEFGYEDMGEARKVFRGLQQMAAKAEKLGMEESEMQDLLNNELSDY